MFYQVFWQVKNMAYSVPMASTYYCNPVSPENGETVFEEVYNYDNGTISPNIVYSVESKENIKKGKPI